MSSIHKYTHYEPKENWFIGYKPIKDIPKYLQSFEGEHMPKPLNIVTCIFMIFAQLDLSKCTKESIS